MHQNRNSFEHLCFLVEQCHFCSSVPQSIVFLTVDSLLHIYLHLVLVLLPINLKHVQRGSHKPHFLPLGQSKFLLAEIVTQFLKEIINRCIAPLKSVEIVAQRFRKILLAHQRHELLQTGSSLRVGNSIKNRISFSCIGHVASNRMSCSVPEILPVTKYLPIPENSHSRIDLIFEFILDLLNTEITDKISKTFIQP